jgi:hypothetical protein
MSSHVPNRPEPGELVLHECGGVPRAWAPKGVIAACTGCGEVVAGDCDYVEGHAFVHCSACDRTIGLCAAPLFDALAESAMAIIRGAP